jgi:CRP-like cAMP-binding protein
VSKVLRAAGPDDMLGLSEAVSMVPYECTARTRTAARGGFIPLTDFRRLLDENPSLWLYVARLLSVDVNACLASVRAIAAR